MQGKVAKESMFLGMSVSPSRENGGGPVNSAGKDSGCGQHNPDAGGQSGRKGGSPGKLTSLKLQQMQILRLSVGVWPLNLQLLNVRLHQILSGGVSGSQPWSGTVSLPFLTLRLLS